MVPHMIRVGAEEFEVDVTGELPSENDGDFHRNHGRIRIREGLPPHYERTVALHEALHAIMERSGLQARLGDNKEEEVVSVLAEWLTDFIRDNPEFMRYIASE